MPGPLELPIPDQETLALIPIDLHQWQIPNACHLAVHRAREILLAHAGAGHTKGPLFAYLKNTYRERPTIPWRDIGVIGSLSDMQQLEDNTPGITEAIQATLLRIKLLEYWLSCGYIQLKDAARLECGELSRNFHAQTVELLHEILSES